MTLFKKCDSLFVRTKKLGRMRGFLCQWCYASITIHIAPCKKRAEHDNSRDHMMENQTNVCVCVSVPLNFTRTVGL